MKVILWIACGIVGVVALIGLWFGIVIIATIWKVVTRGPKTSEKPKGPNVH